MNKNISVIYEDNHLLVVNKPANIPVQPDISGDDDMLTLLKQMLKIKYNKPGNVFLGLVHRLDRPASGVMIFAKTSKAASRLSDQFRRKLVRKEYLIVIQGHLQISGTLTHFLLKDREHNVVSAVDDKKKGAKKAVLHFETLEYNQGLSLVQVELETGRSHQIRVQFATNGSPLWGDHRYNNNISADSQLALHSYHLSFRHPTKKDIMDFVQLPDSDYPWSLFKRITGQE